MTLPCIACGKKLESACPDEVETNQPSGGTCFYTFGHYGSTFWDLPFDHSKLEINVCDDCLRRAEKDKCIMRYRKDDQLVGEIFDNQLFLKEAEEYFKKYWNKAKPS